MSIDSRKLSGPVSSFWSASENPANLKSRGLSPCDIKVSRLPFLAERKKSSPAWICVVISATAFSITRSALPLQISNDCATRVSSLAVGPDPSRKEHVRHENETKDLMIAL